MAIFFETLAISLCIQLVLFIPAFVFRTDKLTDLSYSLTFALLAIILYVQSSQSVVHLLLLIMVLAWAFRLGVYLVVRINRIGKDARFDGIRENFFRFAKFWVLQGFVVWLVMFSSITLFGGEPTFTLITLIGLLIFTFGFLLETIADYQKYRFKLETKNKNKFICHGVWKYSRYPNYFGEFLVWLGIFVFSLSSVSGISLIGILSPLFILLVLLFGTGIPMLEVSYEKRFGKRKDYQEYKRRTSKFVFWFQRK